MGVDEEGTLNALRAHREVVEGLVVAHRGRIFSSAGDSIVAELKEHDYKAQKLVELIILSVPFQYQAPSAAIKKGAKQ